LEISQLLLHDFVSKSFFFFLERTNQENIISVFL